MGTVTARSSRRVRKSSTAYRGLVTALGLVFLLGSPRAMAGPGPVTGHWEGAFVRLNSIQKLAVDIESDGQMLRGRYDIPDQGLYDEPLGEVAFEPPALTMKLLYGASRCRCTRTSGR